MKNFKFEKFCEIMAILSAVTATFMLFSDQIQYAIYFMTLAIFYKTISLQLKQ